MDHRGAYCFLRIRLRHNFSDRLWMVIRDIVEDQRFNRGGDRQPTLWSMGKSEVEWSKPDQ